MVKSGNKVFSDYYVVALTSDNLPADFETYENILSDKHNLGTLNNYLSSEDADIFVKGRDSVEEYTRKNLADTEAINNTTNNRSEVSAVDGWSISVNEDGKKVKGTVDLKYKRIDARNDVYGPLYYVVTLEENIRHLFLPGWFDDMYAPVKAVVLLQPHDRNLIVSMQSLERSMVIGNWEYQNLYKGTEGAYAGKWNHYQAGKADNNKTGIKYTSGDAYRTENVSVTTTIATRDGGQKTAANTVGATKASEGNFYSANEIDSINIDARADIAKIFKADWDLGQAINGSYSYTHVESGSWLKGYGDDKRIHFNIDFNDKFPTRNTDGTPDILWTRIESDPIILQKNYKGKDVSNYNSVRQITLNFNVDNSDVSHYRPYCIFYTGPENINYATDTNGVLLRHSRPVIINLNENTNAIIYMPESPVIINGNEKKLTGFVIAKCFLKAVTEDDMLNETAHGNSFVLYDGFNAPTSLRGEFNAYKDTNDNTIYIKPTNLLTKEQVENLHKNSTIAYDDKNNISISQAPQATKYLLLNYTKADSENETYEVIEDGKHNENKTFAKYINATYKEKFKKLWNLSDSEITAIRFPDKDYNETTAIYYVATSDFLTYDPDPGVTPEKDKYVEVIRVDDNSTKFIPKAKLPYVKTRIDSDYFYVCVYDLKLYDLKSNNGSNSKGIRMIDKDYDENQIKVTYLKNTYPEYKDDKKIDNSAKVSNADVYINFNTAYGDSWAIYKTLYNNRNNWKKDKMNFYSINGVDCFTFITDEASLSTQTEVVAKYRKVIDGDNTKYVKEGSKLYYMKVFNNTKNPDDYIIVDENGDILIKPITSPKVFNVKTEADSNTLNSQRSSDSVLRDYWNTYTREPNSDEIPGDEGQVVEGYYRGKDEARLRTNKDYRIPALERVYNKKSVFNLSEDSRYSYFQIENLWRVNYTYMNVNEAEGTVNRKPSTKLKVDDMFFTKKRAEWID